jgi:carbonic anhydrase
MKSDDLLIRHLKYKNSPELEKDYLKSLAINGQKPHTMFIGCCDSRVIPESLTDSKPGELFVLRNIANRVPSFQERDESVISAVTYGIKYLGVQHIVVCGHTGCGGVEASKNLDLIEDISLKSWVSKIKPCVEGNVINSLINLETYPVVLEVLQRNSINLHGWIYDINRIGLNVWDGFSWISAEDIVRK